LIKSVSKILEALFYGGMVSVYRDGDGWWFITEVDRTRYYTSLAEAMAAAYACEDGKAAGHGVAANGNR
jgi:hypothetical protein